MSEFANREFGDTLCLFDVDGTMTVARAEITEEMQEFMARVRAKVAIGLVGGSDLVKIEEQMKNTARTAYDFTFAENGLTAYKGAQELETQSFLGFLGEQKMQKLVNFCLKHIASLEIPQKRGTFVEFRNGMINVSPIGRNCSRAERNAFEAYDKEHGIRKEFVGLLEKEFAGWGLKFSIGGQISFDVFPEGWDKTYCLRHVKNHANFKRILFFGDKTFEGGNDYEIYNSEETEGHAVTSWEDTREQLSKLFDVPIKA
ncbi:uncharacterized protein MONBRDRAFT_20131 [Monosiga brevicollis MX1]|uniref:Phosphomannomutase n=1 Tax=Monosiga brevicollis TaxID=81824 RepID=A9UU74_MONBE|nr:uncharacterized protein MONBRDRAFT_20131 [Monosiga brevicollis MX1]EDQ91618.1 predicted protein [Monosiga brevicollis MX1]|eukprot:XP_001744040.1 hypothetical protein [Monosiga brevicollis MX1]